MNEINEKYPEKMMTRSKFNGYKIFTKISILLGAVVVLIGLALMCSYISDMPEEMNHSKVM